MEVFASETGAEAVAVTVMASEAKMKAVAVMMVVSMTAADTVPDSINGLELGLYHRFINTIGTTPTSIKTSQKMESPLSWFSSA